MKKVKDPIHYLTISLRICRKNELIKNRFYYIKAHVQEKLGTRLSNIEFLEYCMNIAEKYISKKEKGGI